MGYENTVDEFEKWLDNMRKNVTCGLKEQACEQILAKYRAFKAKDKAVEPGRKWAVVRKGWWCPYNLVAKVLSAPIECGQKWIPLQWDGMDDPDYFKEVGLIFFETREQARAYLESLPDANKEAK